MVKRWIQKYRDFILLHDLPNRIFSIQTKIQYKQWCPDLAIEYEEIRALRKKGIKYADSKCCKLKIGEVPWSMTLQRACDNI